MPRHHELPIQERSPDSFISEAVLARHWDVSQRTLQRWRKLRKGPPYTLIGGCVRYRLSDIRSHETRMRRDPEARQ